MVLMLMVLACVLVLLCVAVDGGSDVDWGCVVNGSVSVRV